MAILSRQAFEIQAKPISLGIDIEKIPQGILRNPFLIDVTDQYFPTKDITLEVSSEEDIAYLCTYNNGEFSAVVLGPIEDGNVNFKNVTKELLYFPMYYRANSFVPAANPFIVRDNGNVIEIDMSRDTMVNISNVKLLAVENNITRPNASYQLYHWDNMWRLAAEEITMKDTTLNFTNIPGDGLYLVKGSKGSEKVQRPFTFFNNKIEYW